MANDNNNNNPPSNDDAIKSVIKRFEEMSKSSQVRQAELQKELALIEKMKKYWEDQTDSNKTLEQQLRTNSEIKAAEIQQAEKKIQLLKLQLEAEKEKEQLDTEEIANLNEKLAKQEEILELMGKRQQIQDEFVKSAELSLTAITGTVRESDTLLHKFKLLRSNSQDFGDTMARTVGTLAEHINLASIHEALVRKMVASTILYAQAQDQALASFNKATGAAGKYNSQIIDLERSNSQFKLSIDDAGGAFQNLFTGMTNFSAMSEDAQNKIALTTAALEKLGVDGATTAKNMNIATRALGMTGDQAEYLARDLLTTAQTLSIPPQALADGFAEAAPQLAAQGDKMVGIFKKLAKQSKQTGVAVGELLGIVGKFDTFEGAADAAGNLNAILGGDLVNSVELLMADEAERVKILQDTISASGRSWASMNKFERQAVASAAGISDMNKAAMLFNPTMEGLNKEEKERAKSMQELQELMPQVTTLMDDMKLMMTKFAVSMRPVIELLKGVFDAFFKLNDFTGGYLIPIIVGFTTLGLAIGPATAALGAFWKGFTAGPGIVKAAYDKIKSFGGKAKDPLGIGSLVPDDLGLGGGDKGDKVGKPASSPSEAMGKTGDAAAKADKPTRSFTDNFVRFARAANRNRKGLLALAAVFVSIGAGIGLAALGAAQLVKAFKGLTGEQILGGLGSLVILFGAFILLLKGMIPVIGALGAVSGAVAVPLVALGFAFLLMGGGIGLAALGAAQLVKSFEVLTGGQIIGGLGSLLILFGGFILLLKLMVPVIIALGVVGAAVAGPLVALGAAFLLLGAAVGLAALGMAQFVAAFKGIDPLTLLAFGASMLMLTTAMAGFVLTAPFATYAAYGAAVSFGLLALAMSSVGESAKAMTEFNKTLIQLSFDPIIKGYERVSELIEEIVGNINGLSIEKTIAFSAVMAGTALASALSEPAASAATAGTDRLAAASKNKAEGSSDIGGAGSATNAAQQVNFSPQIVLEVDGKELARAVWKNGIGKRVAMNEESSAGVRYMTPLDVIT